jgi:hypothetical protein
MRVFLAIVLLLASSPRDAAAQTSPSRLSCTVAPPGADAADGVGDGGQPGPDGFAETRMLAREAARDLTARMTHKLCAAPDDRRPAHNISTLIIYSAVDLTALSSYAFIRDQFESFLEEFEVKRDEAERLLKHSDPGRIPALAEDAADGIQVENDFGRPGDFGLAALAVPGISAELSKSIAALSGLPRADAVAGGTSGTIGTEDVVSFLIDDLNRGSLEIDGEVVTCTASRPTVYSPGLYPPQLLADNTTGKLFDLLRRAGSREAEARENIRRLNERIARLEGLAAAIQSREKMSRERADKLREKALADEHLEAGGLGRGALEESRRKSAALAEEVGQLADDIGQLTKLIASAVTDLPRVLAFFMDHRRGWVDNLKTLKSRAQILVAAAEQVMVKLNAPDEATGLTPLAQLLRAEHMAALLESTGTYTLRINVTAGGAKHVKRRLFLSPQVSYAAWAELNYQIFDHDGQLVMANNLQRHFAFQSAASVRKLLVGRSDGGPSKANGSPDFKKDASSAP